MPTSSESYTIRKPMLAAGTKGKDAEEQEKYEKWIEAQLPLLGSPKLDGIRCLVHPLHGAVSRRFKPIPNDYIRETLKEFCPTGMDGELVTYDVDGTVKDFNEIQGDVMRKEGRPQFRFLIFDDFSDSEMPFALRISDAETKTLNAGCSKLRFIEHHMVKTMEELNEFTQQCLDLQYEGAMFRSPTGVYKEGRSTVKQCWLIKRKAFEDAEGVIVGIEELMINNAPEKRDAAGGTDRSTAKEHLVRGNTMGALSLMTKWGELRVGSGFSDEQRKELWDTRNDIGKRLFGKVVTFTYQPFGMGEKPRFPTFKGFRHLDDS